MKKHLYLSGLFLVSIITNTVIGMKEDDLTESQFSVSPGIDIPIIPSNRSNVRHGAPLINVSKRNCKDFRFLEARSDDVTDSAHHLIIINKPAELKDLFTLAVNQAHFQKSITHVISLPAARENLFQELKILLGLESSLSEDPELARPLINHKEITHITLIAQDHFYLRKEIVVLSMLFPNRTSFIRHKSIEKWKKALLFGTKKSMNAAHLSMSLLSKEELRAILKKATDEAHTHVGISSSSDEEEKSTESSESPSTIHYPSPATSKESTDSTDDSDLI